MPKYYEYAIGNKTFLLIDLLVIQKLSLRKWKCSLDTSIFIFIDYKLKTEQ